MRKCLRDARKALGLTQQAVADRVGISLRQYKNIESGKTVGTVQLWDVLEDMTGINQRVLREMNPDKEDSR